MGFGVFLHRVDSIYDDNPATHYQFPKQYHSRAAACIGDWIVYYEPTKVVGSRGYYAVAQLERIVPDPTRGDMFLALMVPGTYLSFPHPVPFLVEDGVAEKGLLNEFGRISGRAQAAVRSLSSEDFERIVSRGLTDADALLPRLDTQVETPASYQIDEGQVPFGYERVRVEALTSRVLRDRIFRRVVLEAYDERCAVTGLKLINGGGRAEVEAAHIQPVAANGPDIVNNGVPLSGTVHWMFDRGLITFSDDLDIVISRHVNDRDGVASLINKTGKLIGPTDRRSRPHPAYLAWHRDTCFKQ